MVLISVKFIVIGLIVGLVVGCGWIGLKYIMSACIRVGDDIVSVYGLSVLGNISGGAKKSKWFRKPYDTLTTEEQLAVTVANIKVIMKHEGKQTVFLTSDATTDRCKEICNALRDGLCAQGISCRVEESITGVLDSMQDGTETEAVVLVEQIDVSRYEMIGKEIELCNKCSVPVLGAVVVE